VNFQQTVTLNPGNKNSNENLKGNYLNIIFRIFYWEHGCNKRNEGGKNK
jgi:hypothetical protein